MPWFEYEGLTPGGTAIAGRVEAASSERARTSLADTLIEVRELHQSEPPPPQRGRLRPDDLVFFNQQLASLAEAGIALDEGLAQLARDVQEPRLRGWLEGLVEDLRRGTPLDQAIAAREAGLPILYSRVLRSGMETGHLSATLLNLNQHLRLAGNTRRIVWEVTAYPLIVLVLALGLMGVLFTTVIPQFRDIFRDFGTQLPAITRLLLDVADVFPIIALVLGIIVVGAAFGWHFLRFTPGGRSFRESLVLGLPVIGRVHRASLMARFLRSVSTAIGSGLPLPQAIRLASGATGSMILEADADHLAREVERGQSIFVANQSTRVVPPLFGYCVQIAAGRDALPAAIAQLAQSYERRAVQSQSLIRTILLPAIVVLVGGGLALIVVAMFLPLVHLINSVSSGG
ncbi:MAG: hypothetical protein AMXMBFR13_09290 [Phycisphaerae bacterium]